MKHNLLFALLLAIFLSGAANSAQTFTSNQTVRWQATAATQKQADDDLDRYLASAIQGSGVDADIYQREADGSIKLDAVGRKKIAPAKARAAFKAILEAKVKEWAEAGDIGELNAIQAKTITDQVKAQAKPAVQ